MNLTRIYAFFISIIIIVVSSNLVSYVDAQSDTEVGSAGMSEKGDFIEMETWTYIDDPGLEVAGHMRLEITGSGQTTVNNVTYDCYTAVYYGRGDINSDYGDKGSWKIDSDLFIDRITGNIVRETGTSDMNIKIKSYELLIHTDSTKILLSKSSTWTGDASPQINDTWSVTTVENETIEEFYRAEENTESRSDAQTKTTVTHYTYLEDGWLTTKLGTNKCRVYESYDNETPVFVENYTLEYIDKEKDIPIKTVIFEYGETASYFETIAYKIGDMKGGTSVLVPEEDDRGLFGLGKIGPVDVFYIIIAVIVIAVTVVLLLLNKRRKAKAERR